LNISKEIAPESKLRYREIPHFSKRPNPGFVFPKSGADFFNKHTIQKEGKFPVVIIPPSGLDDDQIISLYKAWDLWSLDEGGSCILFDHEESRFQKVKDSKIHIRILGYKRDQALVRLMTQLNDEVDFMGDKVDLHVSIDGGPLGNASYNSAKAFKKVWKHGSFFLRQFSTRKGIVGQWTGAWDGISFTPNDVLVVLEDDVKVSSEFYRYLKAALPKYRYESVDSNVFGLGFEIPSIVIGETIGYSCCGKKSPGSLASKDHTMYRYQLPGTWGTVLFPEHWKSFLEWFDQHRKLQLRHAFTPCVHTLKTNVWWEAKPESVFSAWLVRYLFEKGFYMLYPNFGKLKVGLSASFREAGEHSRSNRSRLSSRLAHSGDLFEVFSNGFPDVETIPVYDFHFNDVSESPESLKYRSLLYGNVKNLKKFNVDIPFIGRSCYRIPHYKYKKTVETSTSAVIS
jgi:hypothetical protein